MPLLLDVTSLALRRNAGVMTGIDRIEFALADWLAGQAAEHSSDDAFLINSRWVRGIMSPSQMVGFVEQCRCDRLVAGTGGTLLQSLAGALRESLSGAGGVGVRRIKSVSPPRRRASNKTWREAIGGSLAFSNWLVRYRGDIRYVHASHYGLQWERGFSWTRKADVSATIYIHDLIPIDFPQYCSLGAHQNHKRKIITATGLADRMVVNSAHTRDRLANWLRAEGLRMPPIDICRPAAEPIPGSDALGSTSVMAGELPPFYLCAGTLEGRKNLPLLLAAWRQLAQRLPAKDVPRLVLAGQRGWCADDFFRDLDTMRDIAPFVIEVEGLNDTELAAVMKQARAVIKPSLAEGFSLVPAEALSNDIPVLLSDIPAHRELHSVLGGRAAFFDPASHEDLCALIEGGLTPTAVPPGLPRRGWEEFSRAVFGNSPASAPSEYMV